MAETPKSIRVDLCLLYPRWTVRKYGRTWRVGRPSGGLWRYCNSWDAAMREADRVAHEYRDELVRAYKEHRGIGYGR
jgi:hypothetical protein